LACGFVYRFDAEYGCDASAFVSNAKNVEMDAGSVTHSRQRATSHITEGAFQSPCLTLTLSSSTFITVYNGYTMTVKKAPKAAEALTEKPLKRLLNLSIVAFAMSAVI
jgi:hypothetical protein